MTSVLMIITCILALITLLSLVSFLRHKDEIKDKETHNNALVRCMVFMCLTILVGTLTFFSYPRCPNCDYRTINSYCESCGTQLNDNRCKNCGNTCFTPYCGECGTKQEE